MFKDKITNIIKNKIDGIAITYEEEDGFPEINDLLDKIPELERKITELENKLGTQVIYTLDGTTLNIDTK